VQENKLHLPACREKFYLAKQDRAAAFRRYCRILKRFLWLSLRTTPSRNLAAGGPHTFTDSQTSVGVELPARSVAVFGSRLT
jgi:hypothetical protein